MKLFQSPSARESDDEHIASLRCTIERCDRWRIGLVLANVGMLAGLIWAFVRVVPLVVEVAQPANAPIAAVGFVTGGILGFAFGAMAYGIIRSLIVSLGGFRTERLLLKFYDARDSQSLDDER